MGLGLVLVALSVTVKPETVPEYVAAEPVGRAEFGTESVNAEVDASSCEREDMLIE